MIYSIITLFILNITFQITKSCQCPENHLFNPKTNSCLPDTPKTDNESYQEGCKLYGINTRNEGGNDHEEVRHSNQSQSLKSSQFQTYICKTCKNTYYPNQQYSTGGFTCEKTDLINCSHIQKNYDTNSQQQQINQRFLGNSNEEPPPPPPPPSHESNITIHNKTQIPQYTCSHCIEGYYVQNNTCTTIPQQGDSDFIEGCISYFYNKNSNKTQCEFCQNGYYHKNKSCEKNPTTPKNCSYFKWNEQESKAECGGCQYNHYFDNSTNECLSYNITVQGCSKYGFINGTQSCVRCNDHKLLIWYNGTYCGKIEDKLPGCLQAYVSDSSRYVCQSCDSSKYYLKNSKCEPFPSENDKNYIKNCTGYQYDYSNAVLECQSCDGQLVAHKKECISPTTIVKNCGGYSYDEKTKTTHCSNCQINFTSPQQPIHKCYQCLTGGNSASLLIFGFINTLLIVFILY